MREETRAALAELAGKNILSSNHVLLNGLDELRRAVRGEDVGRPIDLKPPNPPRKVPTTKTGRRQLSLETRRAIFYDARPAQEVAQLLDIHVATVRSIRNHGFEVKKSGRSAGSAGQRPHQADDTKAPN